MLLSIIVPVYQVEDYLETCIKSMLNCHGFSYEIILVLKPSEDRSRLIADNLQKEHSDKVKIINQEQNGLSNARNVGLRHAKGEYVVFFDSDDYIDANAFTQLMTKLESRCSVDVVISDYSIVGNSNNISYVDTIEGEDLICDNSYLETFLKKRRNYWNAWQYVLKRSFLLENKLFFLEGVHSEDIEFATRVILSAKKISFFGKPYYYYRIGREGSLANNVTLKHIIDLMDMLGISIERIKKDKFNYKDLLLDRLLLQYILSFVMIYDVDREEKVDARRYISIRKPLYKEIKCKDLRQRMFLKLGIGVSAYILKIMRDLRRTLLKIH